MLVIKHNRNTVSLPYLFLSRNGIQDHVVIILPMRGIANVFLERIAFRIELERFLPPGPSLVAPRLRVVIRHLQLDMRSVGETVPLHEVKCVAHVVAYVLADPQAPVEADRIDDQRVPVPFSNGISKIAGKRILVMVAIEPDYPALHLFLKHLIDTIGQDNKLKWIIMRPVKLHRHAQWLAVLSWVMALRNIRRHSICVCNPALT